jgi:ABC-type antimicrobial peptide transport system permease subunit
MAAAGVLSGAVFGYILASLAGSYFPDMKMPGATVVVVAALVTLGAAVVSSMLPAARATRINVIAALHPD